ncbi:MAG: hypothetical protein ACFFCS_17640, partial [Candidatus Hodarchaeota archaeon]
KAPVAPLPPKAPSAPTPPVKAPVAPLTPKAPSSPKPPVKAPVAPLAPKAPVAPMAPKPPIKAPVAPLAPKAPVAPMAPKPPVKAAIAPIPPKPAQAVGKDQLIVVLNQVLSKLNWPNEKKDALVAELINLPKLEQIDFLEQIGVDVSGIPGFGAPGPVAPSAPAIPMKPSIGAKPPVAPKAVGLFSQFDDEIAAAMSDDLDVESFLESGLELDLPDESLLEEVTATAAETPLAKLVPTKVEKKTDEEIKAEEEKLKAAKSSDANLVYLRLLAFEKAASGYNKYKMTDFSKMLKDLDPGTIISFIKELDNEFLIDYDQDKKTVIINDPSPPEVEIISREFEKWLRFGRL